MGLNRAWSYSPRALAPGRLLLTLSEIICTSQQRLTSFSACSDPVSRPKGWRNAMMTEVSPR